MRHAGAIAFLVLAVILIAAIWYERKKGASNAVTKNQRDDSNPLPDVGSAGNGAAAAKNDDAPQSDAYDKHAADLKKNLKVFENLGR